MGQIRSKMTLQRSDRWIAGGLFLVFLYTLWRAWTVSISHDEALTYLHHVRASWLEIVRFSRPFPSNNHLLNTLLIKGLVQPFGLSEFVMRMPALLGHALYLVGMYKIARTICTHKMLLGAMCLVALQPYMLDLFSCARGYALGLGFMSLSLYYFLSYVSRPTPDTNPKPIALACWFMTLATLANLSFLHLYMAMVLFFVLFECVLWKNGLKTSQPPPALLMTSLKNLGPSIFLSGLCLVGSYTIPIRTLIKHRELYYGGEHGFWGSTVSSLIEMSLYGQSETAAVVVLLIESLIVVVWIAACLYLSRRWMKNRTFEAKEQALFALMLLIALCVSVIWAQRLLLGTKFVIGRTAIYFCPLFFLCLILLWSISQSIQHHRVKRLINVAATLVVLVISLHALRSLNTSYFYEWKYDSSTKAAMQEIRQRHAGQALEANAKSIGLHWLFEPSINFYRVQYDLHFLQQAHRGGPFNKFDYYYIFDQDDPDLKQHRIQMSRMAELRPHLKTVQAYDASNTILAVPKDF